MPDMKLFFVRFFSLFIPSKKYRRSFRDWCLKPHTWKYKLGVFYSLFDGEELLEASIRSIRDNVDYICVGYQEISYTGNRSETDLKPMLEDLKSRKLIDDYFLYETDLNKMTAVNETAKRQMGIEHALKNKCTHFFNIDTDEFFIFEQMKAAKQYLYENDVDVSFVYAVEYVKEPIYQCFKKYNLNPAVMPFISKINKRTRAGEGFCPAHVDPTRRVSTEGRLFLFPPHQLLLHHMSRVRKNLRKKYKNSSFLGDKNEVNAFVNGCEQVIDWNPPDPFPDESVLIRKVDNIFNIHLN